MKITNVILTIFFITIALGLQQATAQEETYIPLPENNGVWQTSVDDWVYITYAETPWMNYWSHQLVREDRFYTNGVYSNQDSQTSVEIRKTGSQQDDLIGYIRNASGKVWFTPLGENTEYLVYDFTLEIGDSINYYAYIGGHYDLQQFLSVVEAIEYAEYGGELRKIIRFDDTYDLTAWIEGIGSDSGFLLIEVVNVSNFPSTNLSCMSVNSESIYPSASDNACEFIIGIEEQSNSPRFSIFPNPTKTELNIKLQGATATNLQTKLTNQLGQTFDISVHYNGDEIQLDTSQLLAGLYILQIIHEGKSYFQRIVKRD